MSQTNTNGASAAASPDAQATIDAARRAAEQVAEDLAKRVTEFAAEAGEAVRAAISKASASAGKISDQAIEGGKTCGQDVMQAITKQPVAALLIVGATAFVTGLLLARR